jgi:nucleoside-diphosphate-sugar epimerase
MSAGGSGAAPVLVTGANGFLGRHVCEELVARGRPFRMLVRPDAQAVPAGGVVFRTPSLLDEDVLRAAMNGCRAVIHLAARVHVMRDRAADPLMEFRRVNVEATRVLARCAVDADAPRFVFISSAKVNGESTMGAPFRDSDPPAPADPYGQSKWEAEQVLRHMAVDMGLEVVVLRPPLMYGAGVMANFLKLMQLVHRGVPLPLGSIRNRRSFVFVRNVANAAVVATEHPCAAGETFLVSDGLVLSSAELVQALAEALGRRERLLPIPPALLRAAGKLARRQAVVGRLLESLEVDSGRIGDVLGWRPPYSMEDGFKETAEWFMAAAKSGV